MEKKEYEVPSYELILLEQTDVITESKPQGGDIETPIEPLFGSVW